jgi:predicted transcriptional regulator YdeE
MNYRIEEVGDFSVCGMRTEITKWQNRNIAICRSLWISFNKILKRKHQGVLCEKSFEKKISCI